MSDCTDPVDPGAKPVEITTRELIEALRLFIRDASAFALEAGNRDLVKRATAQAVWWLDDLGERAQARER